MFAARSIAGLILTVALSLGGFSGVVSSAIDIDGVWFGGVASGPPTDVAIVVAHGVEAPAEVASSSFGLVPRSRDLHPAGASLSIAAIRFVRIAASPAIHVLNCVFIE